MRTTIGIDPGTRQCGFAFFVDDEPESCGLVQSALRTVEERAVDMASQLVHACGMAYPMAVVERPVIYPNSRERDSDIVDLAVTAGVVAGALRKGRLRMPTPREWKGTVPKKIHNERTAARCPAAVALIAKLPKGQRNHVWDAVGLALWGIEKERVRT